MQTSVQGMCVSGQEPAHPQGSQEQVAQALLVEQLPLLLPNPALLWVQIWGGSYFEEFKISSPGRSLWSAHTLVSRHVPVPSALVGLHLTAARSQDPGIVILTGEGAVAYLTPGGHRNCEGDRI